MAAIDIVRNNLGVVYVGPPDAAPTLTLFVTDDPRFGLLLMDHAGVRVSPKSGRLGYHGARGSSDRQIVCDDDVSDETMSRLVEVGYFNVIRRG